MKVIKQREWFCLFMQVLPAVITTITTSSSSVISDISVLFLLQSEEMP